MPGVPAKVATVVVPARNWTWVTVAPPDPGVAFAVNVTALPAVDTEPASGAVRVAVGAELFTVTETAAEVAAGNAPVESITCAVSAVTPAAAGVHVME